MAENVIYKNGDQFEIPVISGTVSGGPVILGAFLPGVALTDRDADGNAVCKFSGVVDVSIVAAGAQSVGAPIYITAATYALTDASGAGKYFYGTLLEAIAGASTVTRMVRIGGSKGA
jgi:predicted RecA/RadA family phage recombinase